MHKPRFTPKKGLKKIDIDTKISTCYKSKRTKTSNIEGASEFSVSFGNTDDETPPREEYISKLKKALLE